MNNYILIDGEPVRCDDIFTWGPWFNNIENRRVDDTEVREGVRVSTVFLGIDHSFLPGAKPVLWETMTFTNDPETDQHCWRYASLEDARRGHEKVVRWLKEGGEYPEA